MNEIFNPKLDDLIACFKKIREDDDAMIPRDLVIAWMKSNDIDVLGAIYAHCTNRDYYTKIDPNLTAEDYYNLIKVYFKRCLQENPSGEWTDTRYEAGWSFVGWFKKYWKDKSIPREYLSELKEWLAEIYISGGDDVRLCISTAVLEHLFDNKGISKFFLDWQDDEILKQAFDEAMGCAGKIAGPA